MNVLDGRSIGLKHVATPPPAVPEVNVRALQTQPQPLLEEAPHRPGSHELPPVGRPPRWPLRRTVARVSAIVVAMGLVGAVGFIRWDRTTVHTGGPVSIASGVNGQRLGVGEPTSFGGIVLLNQSTKPALIEKVRILGVSGGFEVLGVRTNPVPFPPNDYLSASLAQRHVVPVSRSRTASGGPNEGLQLVIGARATEAGVARARGVEVSYRVGQRHYRRSHEGPMYLCAPGDEFPGNSCPGETEGQFGNAVVDFPAR